MLSDHYLFSTKTVVTDYFNWRLRNKPQFDNRLFDIVRRIGDECERKFSSQQFCWKLHGYASMIHVKNIHCEIGKELFNDGRITWNRIISFISFSALLTENIVELGYDEDGVISLMIESTTNFIDRNLEDWLVRENYWIGCLMMYAKSPERRHYFGEYSNLLGIIALTVIGLMYVGSRWGKFL